MRYTVRQYSQAIIIREVTSTKKELVSVVHTGWSSYYQKNKNAHCRGPEADENPGS